jgi:pectate lyase
MFLMRQRPPPGSNQREAMRPAEVIDVDHPDTNHAYIAATGNVYDNTTRNKETGLGGTGGDIVGAWTPTYSYKLDKAEDVPSIVQRCAGPQ